MRSLRCMAGRHRWETGVVRHEGGRSIHRRCTRCGKETTRFRSGASDTAPSTGDRTRPRMPELDGPGGG